MKSFYVDITKCKSAGGNFDSAESELRSASKKLDGAADGVKAMGGALVAVGACVDQIAHEAAVEAGEVAQLKNAINSILQLYYMQEAGLIGQAVNSGVQNVIDTIGDTIRDRVQDIADIIGRGKEAIREHIINNAYEDLDFFIRTATGFVDKDYWKSYFNQMTDNVMGDFGGIINIATGGWEIIFAEDGKYVEYIVDLVRGNEIDTNYYDFLKADGSFDFGEFLEGELIPDFKPNRSTLGNVLKWGGKIVDGLDYASIIGEDFMDVIYNEETRQCEWTVQNIGYFTSDVIVDGAATFGCNFAGDLVGKLAGGAVAAIPGGAVVAPIVDFAVSTAVSNIAEFAINFDLPLDLNGDGEFDSVVDMAKIVGREGVDNIIAVGEFVGENVYGYMVDNHPELTQAISDTLNPIINAGEAVFEHATDTFDNVLNAAIDLEGRAKDYVGDLVQGGLESAVSYIQTDVEYFSNQAENVVELVDDLRNGEGLSAVGEYVSNSIDNGFEYAGNVVDNLADSANQFLDNTANFAQDCLSILGWN